MNRALAVGALVAIAGAAFVVAITFFRKGGYAERDTYTVFASFRDATGLTWKSRVQIAGIQIGEVSKITLQGDRARLELRVKREIALHANACLTKAFPSALLPDALLEVVPGSDPSPVLRDLPDDQREITCIREATTVQQLTDALAQIASDVQAVTGDLRKTVGSPQGSLREIVENVSKITRSVDQLLGDRGEDLAAIVKNARSFTKDLSDMSQREKDRVHAIAVNIEAVTRQLREVLGSMQEILDGGQPAQGGQRPPRGDAGPLRLPVLPAMAVVDGRPVETASQVGQVPADASAQAGQGGQGGQAGQAGQAPAGSPGAPTDARGVRQAVERLNGSLSKLDELLGKVNEGKSPAGRLLTDEKMGRELSTAVTGVSNYVDSLVKLQLEINLRSEWLLNQSGAKTYFGARIIPRPDKYYIVEIVADPRGVDTRTVETVATTVTDPTTGAVLSQTNTSSTKTLHDENKLTFTVQFAKRYGPIAFRAGIIESSGGVGTDLHLLNDNLSVSLSVYQFTRPYKDVFPRAKVWMNYYFLQHFYLTAGADDFLNKWDQGRYPLGPKFTIGNDVFFGGGLFFTDEDLKTLIGAGAAGAVPKGN